MDLGEILSSDDYTRRRIRPSYTDADYLHLSDLHECIMTLAANECGEVFDYGSGGAPYEECFSKSKRYVRADISGGRHLDVILHDDFTTDEPSCRFDVVLSTQVLEHISAPEQYLSEAFRIMKPNARLILTTHGMFQEHGCPSDFHRWTLSGLERLITKHGFIITRSYKLTTRTRAAIQMIHYAMAQILSDKHGAGMRLLLLVIRPFYRRILVPLLNMFADFYSSEGVISGSREDAFYIAICVEATRQETDRR